MGRIVQTIARNALQSLAPLAAFVFAFKGDPLTKIALAAAALAAVVIAVAFLRYWFFRYAVTDRSVLIRDGILNKKQLDIAFDRIQAVNTRQSVLFRVLGLTTVTFDSAGSSAEEGYLPAVTTGTADALRRHIRPATARTGATAPAASPAAKVILRLGAADIVLAGLSSGRVFLLLALLGPLSEMAEREIGRYLEETAVLEALSSITPEAGMGMLLGFALVAAVLLVLLATSVVATFLRYHGFTLTADGEEFRSSGGLLTRHEQSVSRMKVQSTIVTQNAVMRIFRRFRLRIRQASSGRGGDGGAFLVPLCRTGHLQDLGATIFRDEYADPPLDPGGAHFENISPRYMRSRIVLGGLLPSVAAAVLLWPAAGSAALLALLWLPLAALIARLLYRRLGYAIAPHGAAFRSGFVGRRVVVWLHRKVQRVTITQSPFQRRHALATIRFQLAAGPVCIPFIEHGKARALRDYVLYRIEASPLDWH